MKPLLIILSLMICSSCASYRTVTEFASKKEIYEQVILFNNLYIEQPIAMVSARLREGQKIISSFDVKEKDKIYRFMMVHNTQTNVFFGLYFEDDLLKSLILDQDAIELYACRSPVKTRGKHWLYFGMKPYRQWIRDRNKLGKDFDKRIHKPRTSKVPTTSSEIFTGVIFAPLIILATPFYVADKATGGSERLDNQNEAVKLKAKNAAEIPLGYTEEELLNRLGKPYSREITSNSKILKFYFRYSYVYGLRNGKVAWKETGPSFISYENSLTTDDVKSWYKQINCGSLENAWANK